jgi:hypothetical protein
MAQRVRYGTSSQQRGRRRLAAAARKDAKVSAGASGLASFLSFGAGFAASGMALSGVGLLPSLGVGALGYLMGRVSRAAGRNANAMDAQARVVATSGHAVSPRMAETMSMMSHDLGVTGGHSVGPAGAWQGPGAGHMNSSAKAKAKKPRTRSSNTPTRNPRRKSSSAKGKGGPRGFANRKTQAAAQEGRRRTGYRRKKA